MKTINQAVNELEHIVDVQLPLYNIPYKQGKTIRIGKTVVRKSKRNGYMVIDVEENATVTNAFSKHGAVAIAKAYNEGRDTSTFERIDQTVEKHFNDSMFYNYGIEHTQDEFKKVILEDRLEISQEAIYNALDSLERFILTIQR